MKLRDSEAERGGSSKHSLKHHTLRPFDTHQQHWKLVNDMEGYRVQLQAERTEVHRLQQALGHLEAAQAQHAKEALALKATARQVRDQFVANLLSVSKGLRVTQRRAEAAVSKKVPTLEKELQQTKLQLHEAQERLKAAEAEAAAARVAAEAGAAAAAVTMNGGDGHGATERSSSSSIPSKPSPPPSPPPPPPSSLPPPSPPLHTPPHTLYTTLTTLEESLVLRVFSFMNAPDVLAMSEVCKAFNERIGLIFGTGHKHEDEDEEEEEGATATISSTAPAEAAAAAAASSPAIAARSPSSSSFLKNYLGGTADVLSSSFSSLLPPPSSAAAMARSLLGSSDSTIPTSSSSSSSSSSSAPPLASMASKLTSAELKGILAFTERVKKMEALVVQFQVENENVRARLEGAEGVKELLVGKLREAEGELKRAREGESDKERQRVMDQEVIGFLDGRVQELEGGLTTTVARLVEVEEKAKGDVAQSQEQVRVLQDMLGFERRKAEENEGQWRQQKKILAKEVKSLRNGVLVRQKERDAYRDELRNVRLGGGGGGGSGGGGGLSRR